MLFKTTPITALLALTSLSTAASIRNNKRDTTETALYAYGEEANGAPVFYGPGGKSTFNMQSQRNRID